ncbi:hypothetical protein L202_02385 [Cryptococcus amylolentus CBS 6039]|uniref:Uncharacterized protein n=2 Tax=Cryptococcus amylolentus TaxID=104669 RepID=A0A1E3I0N7_9TREE|nr:hypothetical protein L202_02385 [Cryptococcus amylolentus CBS 6039]ODN82068.1 hypothetical protein L202_02385 [Cryptococcus amylolentus CBS 6039]ODO09814.1 hypothetical protein I350_02031 [Cryptococcus amylolentus CBS 6273]
MSPEPKEQANELALLGLAGGFRNVFGLVITGLCMEASYKWFFRDIAILCFASTAVTHIFSAPHPCGSFQRRLAKVVGSALFDKAPKQVKD